MINRVSLSVLLVVLALASALRAEEVELKIDSLVDGGTAAVQAGFVIGETGAVVLDPGELVTLTVLQVQIERFNIGVPVGPPTMTGRMHVWDNANLSGGILAPGTAVYTSPDLILTAGALNLVPVITENIQVSGPFTVGFEIVDTGTDFGITSPSMVTDTNGCQNLKNWVRQTNGVWANLCSFGVSGDLVIRALAETEDDGEIIELGSALAGNFAPTASGTGSLASGGIINLVFAGLPPFETGWLFMGVSQLNAPFLGGNLVPDPILTILIPTGAGGSIVINDNIPAGIPGGVSIYLHMWAADAGGAFGACATNALELVTP